MPPTPKVDYAWADEPALLKGVEVSLNVSDERLSTAQACRAYHYEEPQQVVQSKLAADNRSGKATVSLPPFRYHTMVVFRLDRQHDPEP